MANKKKYKLSYLPQFYVDMSDVVTYLSNSGTDPTIIRSFIDDVEKAILKRLPVCESFEPYHSLYERRYTYYRIYVGNYEIYYVVIDDDPSGERIMEVRRFLHKARNKKKLV